MQTRSRNTLFLEQARILQHKVLKARQYQIRLLAPLTAMAAEPGNFVHIQCAPHLPMRRPMSIMRADKDSGWIDLLYKANGVGTQELCKRLVGECIDLIGPIGVPFKLRDYRKRPLLIGGGVGIPPILFLIEHMKKNAHDIKPLVIMGSEVPFPFDIEPSKIMLHGIPNGVTAAIPLLEDWGITSRLTSLQGYSGCYHGYATELARHWLVSLDEEVLKDVEIFSCGPTPMLEEVSKVAYDYGLDCQVSMEEYMACAIGGCAGCTVLVYATDQENSPAMKRVCVDGPVFEAISVFPQ